MKEGQLSTLTKTSTLDSVSYPSLTDSQTLGTMIKLPTINFLTCKMGKFLVVTCGCYNASVKMLVKVLMYCLTHSEHPTNISIIRLLLPSLFQHMFTEKPIVIIALLLVAKSYRTLSPPHEL